MQLSVILPVYNAPDDVRICLGSLRRNLNGVDGELLIVNDASGPETTRILHDFVQAWQDGAPGEAEERGTLGPPPAMTVRLLEHSRNLGYLRTANQGFAETNGKIIVLLNSDTAIPDGFAQRVLACFASDPAIGVASPVGSHCGLFSLPMKPGLGGEDVDVMDAYLRAWPPEYPTVIMPDGFCYCLRRTALEQAGPFDERFHPGYYEETDLGMRLRRAGWKTVLIDNLYVFHKAQASFGRQRNHELAQRNEALFTSLWGEEFAALRARYPREQHKTRLYRRVYTFPERLWRKAVRFFAQLVPFRETRQRIRRTYN